MLWGQSKTFPQHHMCKGGHDRWYVWKVKCSLLAQNCVFIYLYVSENRYDYLSILGYLFDICKY